MKNLPLPLIAVWHSPPEGESPETRHLMVVLHGRGDSPEGFDWMPGELAISGLHYVMLQAPDIYLDGFSWYDLPPNQLPGILRSRTLLESTFEALFQHGFQPSGIFLFGFSQGCLMTLEFGARFPHRLAGYLGVSGYCYDEAPLLEEANPEALKAPWLITHGTTDDVLPVERTRKQMRWLQAHGFSLDYREYEKSHTVDPVAELPFLKEWILKQMTTVKTSTS
jgi:phospholipase/carboxylesterase